MDVLPEELEAHDRSGVQQRDTARKESNVNLEQEENGGQTPEQGAARVIDLADPARGDDPGEFQGHHYEAGISFIVVDARPGGGPRLHRHPYEEVFVVQESTATFTAGGCPEHLLPGQRRIVRSAPLSARSLNDRWAMQR